MASVIQVAQMQKYIPHFENRDATFIIFYDETNNFRKFRLTEDGLKQENLPFVLGGVALQKDVDLQDWDALKSDLRLQSNVHDVKLKHLAEGKKGCDRYEYTLAQKKISILLQWLIDRDIMIHYSVYDPLYFVTLEIIDCLQADDRFSIGPIHRELKGELHHAIQQDEPAFLALMHRFGFPDVPREQTKGFLRDVETFVDAHLPVNRNTATLLLKQTLKRAVRLPDIELPFLHGNESGELIHGLGNWYIRPVYTFRNAVHIFDEEKDIQEYFEVFEVWDGDRRVNYDFRESSTEIGIQLSDIIAGIFGRHFQFLNSHSMGELLRRRDAFTAEQAENLERLRILVDKSDAFSSGLFFSLTPVDSQMKNNAFLHNVDIPPFMWAQ